MSSYLFKSQSRFRSLPRSTRDSSLIFFIHRHSTTSINPLSLLDFSLTIDVNGRHSLTIHIILTTPRSIDNHPCLQNNRKAEAMLSGNTALLFLTIVATSCNLLPVQALTQSQSTGRRSFLLKNSGLVLSSLVVTTVASKNPVEATPSESESEPSTRKIQPIPRQFIAAVVGDDPTATHGSGADQWGLWTVDPGPRGVRLEDFSKTLSKTKRGPYGWAYDPNDWWLEEHGVIMEQPDFPLAAGDYQVTGGRQVTTILSIQENGEWSLEEGTLTDVTHLPCRSARYTPPKATTKSTCTPARANAFQFPIRPGATMPSVAGCQKQDYAVLFVTGKVVGS